MKPIPALKDVTFEEIKERYIPLAAHFPPAEEILKNEKKAYLDEYERVLQMQIFERAEYFDPLSRTAVCVPNIGLPGMSLKVAVLFAFAINLANIIEIDGIEYRVAVFDRRVLNSTFECNVMDLIKEMLQFPDDTCQIEIKKSSSKIMFITPEEV